jgi:hypothetical protein
VGAAAASRRCVSTQSKKVETGLLEGGEGHTVPDPIRKAFDDKHAVDTVRSKLRKRVADCRGREPTRRWKFSAPGYFAGIPAKCPHATQGGVMVLVGQMSRQKPQQLLRLGRVLINPLSVSAA